MLVDGGRKANLLDLDHLLVLFLFFFTLRLLEAVFAVIHDLAHGRHRLRRDLNQIKVGLLGHAQRHIERHNALLVAFFIDQSDFPVPDFLVDQEFLAGYGGHLRIK